MLDQWPFPTWPDLRIAQESLIHEVDDDEMFAADNGYNNGGNYAMTPTGEDSPLDAEMADTRVHHETVNGMLKVFNCLKAPFRHHVQNHSNVLGAVANVMNLKITLGSIWNVELSEKNFLSNKCW